MTALVSIIIPSYNHESYLAELLESIAKQTYQNLEIVIVDDGSIDGSVDLLTKLQPIYKFKLITKSNEGLCATINRGLDEISGHYIVIIASDDFMPEKRIEEQVDILSKTPFDLIAGGITQVDSSSKELGYKKPLKLGELYLKDLFRRNPIYAPSVMFKRHVFERYGRYDTSNIIEDYPMWINVLSKGGRIAVFDYNWAYYRLSIVDYGKKLDWYYSGIVQTLDRYRNNKVARASLRRNHIRYVFKVAVFDGLNSLIKLKIARNFLVVLTKYFLITVIFLVPRPIIKLLRDYLIQKNLH